MVREDLTNQIFGEWKALEYAGDRKWLCQCSCGAVKTVSTCTLKSGKSKNCGDKVKHPRTGEKQFKDVTGQTFGQLTVLKYVGSSRFLCRCTCGNEITRLRKNLKDTSKCEECSNKLKIKPKTKVESITPIKNSPTAKIDMIGFKVNDITVVKQLDADRYLCRCVCGYEKEIRGYSLRHPVSTDSYTCRHKIQLNQRFGKLTVIKRDNSLPAGSQYVCKCDCGNIIHCGSYSLLNDLTKSCGCSKTALYNKEEVQAILIGYYRRFGYKPFIYDLMKELNVGMTAAYNYINNYELKHLLNTQFGSKAEQEIYELISKYSNVVLHSRKIIPPHEIDIYIPEKKLAIEFNGDYWHSDLHKDRTYHQQKTIACAKQGIRLIHIFEHEWINELTKHKIIGLIKSILNIDKKVIYARNLKVLEIEYNLANQFMDKYHLQNSSNSSINIGLVTNENEIVSVMTFGKPRFNHSYNYEIIRFCNKDTISIIGGAEKLFKYFLDTYNPKSIITYCDISKFTGNVYTRLGFKAIQPNPITEPNYVWVDSHLTNVLTRYQTQKHKLVEQGFGTIEQTEDEIMTMQGYMKVYNSGNLKLHYIKEGET